jgi:catechol 2,3-dioxygenase-like lactoylglutathione lyase family enzyme
MPIAPPPPPPAPLFGRFLELALPTQDIAASVQFYEQLGFHQLLTGDAWPHRYGVLSDGRVYLGLHEAPASAEPHSPAAGRHATAPEPHSTALGLPFTSAAPSFVLPGLARSLTALQAAGIEPEAVHFGEESLHHLQLRDPGGNPVRLQEARTFSPDPDEGLAAQPQSLCGYFMHLSLPHTDFTAARGFWERAGWVALPEEDSPYPHLPLTADQLDLAFHARGGMAAPLLAFECPDVPGALERLAARHIAALPRPARGMSVAGAALLAAPEGTLLWLLPAVQNTQRETAMAGA